jgi:FAD/FMN-containing dehydrogenase
MADIQNAASTLQSSFTGRVITASDPTYDSARRVHNGLIDKRPAIIAQCRGTADVQAAVRLAREHGLAIAVRGGGHNVAGNAVCDGGLVVDLSAMRGVQVDPAARRARAQGGATWADYNR